MTLTQMEVAKNAEKSLPPRCSVRLSLCPRGYSGYSLLPLPRAQLKDKPSNGADATPKAETNARTPKTEATTALPASPPAHPVCSHAIRVEYPTVPPRVL